MAASLALLLAVACTSQTRTTPPAPAAPPVSLPDLSGSEATVQRQINDRYQSLQALIGNHGQPSEVAQAYGDIGSLLLAADYFEVAEPFYLNAQALAPDDVRWPYYLGHVYMSRTDAAKAATSFERALRLRSDDVATLVWLGNVYLDQGEPDVAEQRFARAVTLQPRAVSALFGLGRAAMAKRDYAAAVNRFEQALAADPRASIVHYPLALAYRQLGDTLKAEAHLRQQGTVEVGPPDPLMVELRNLLNSAVAEENRGIRALDARDFASAADHFRKGVELAPDNPSVRHKLGTALSLMGDTRGAIEQFEETIRRAPNFAQSHYSLGLLLVASGDYPRALEQFRDAVRYEPNYVEARLQMADTLRRMGQHDKALVQYDTILAIDPRVAEARFGYAMTLVGLRRYREAHDVLSEAVRLYPDEPRLKEALLRLESLAAAP